MKKLILAGAFALLGAVSMNAQSGNFKLGAHVGLPVGDVSEVSSFTLGVDAAYMFNVAPSFDLGLTTGYSHFFGKDGLDGMGFIPLAASAHFNVAPEFFIGTDLGVAFSTQEGGGSGFYYLPKVGYNMGNGELYLGYQGFSKNGSGFGSVNLGYNFKL